MLPNVPGEIGTIILALHVSIITTNDGKLTGEFMDNVANGVCLCICVRVGVGQGRMGQGGMGQEGGGRVGLVE